MHHSARNSQLEDERSAGAFLTTPKKSKLNLRIVQTLINWLNILEITTGSKQSLQTIKDTRDGFVFIKLATDFVQGNRDMNLDEIIQHEPALGGDTGKRYEFISNLFETLFKIESGVDFVAARAGNEFELSKVILSSKISAKKILRNI